MPCLLLAIFLMSLTRVHKHKTTLPILADAHRIAPHMQTLMIAGNHDSGYRIEQVEPLLEKYNAKTVGVVRWNEDKTLDLDRLLLPIYNQNQDIVAWCLALPFYVRLKLLALTNIPPIAKCDCLFAPATHCRSQTSQDTGPSAYFDVACTYARWRNI